MAEIEDWMAREDGEQRYPDLVRYAYLEPLLEGRRVLLVGAGSAAAAPFLEERGAKHATAVDDAAVESLDFDDGSFDLVVVPDLGACASPDAVLGEARRVLAADGHAVVALANRDAAGGLSGSPPPAFGYYELYDLCASVFPSVKMYGQSPFVGYAVAEFAGNEDEAGISFDASLVSGQSEEVEFFVAVCGEDAPALDPYAVVQIPLVAVAPREVDGTGLDEVREALSEREARLNELEAALQEAQTRLNALREEAGERGIRAHRLEHELRAMEEEARKARDRAAKFARELEDEKRARQRAEIEGQLARRTPEINEVKARNETLAQELDSACERAVALEKDLAEARDASARGSQERERLTAELSSLRQALEGRTGELSNLQQALEGRTASAAEIEAQLTAAVAAEREREARVAEAEARAADARSLASRLAELQTVLDEADRERGEEVSRLERELVRRSREVSELGLELDRQRAIASDVLAELTEAKGQVAEREADRNVNVAIERALQEREAEITSHRAALETLSADRDALREAVVAFAAERDDATIKVHGMQERLLELEGALQAARWDTSLEEARLAEAARAAEAGREAVQALEATLDGERMRVAELEAEVTRAREGLKEQRAAHGATRRELEEERSGREQALTDLDRLRAETAERSEGFERFAAKLQGEARGYRLRTQELAAERDQALAEIETARQDQAPQRVEGEVRGLAFALGEARHRIMELEAGAIAWSDERERLQETVRRERSEGESQLATARHELDEARESLAALQRDADAARAEVDRLMAGAHGLTADLERLRQDHQGTQEELARIRAAATAAGADHRRLAEGLSERDARLAAQAELLRERETALERIAGELADAGARLAENDRDRDRLAHAVAAVEEAKAASERVDREANAELARLRHEVDMREERCRALAAERDAADAAVREMEAERNRLRAAQQAAGTASEAAEAAETRALADSRALAEAEERAAEAEREKVELEIRLAAARHMVARMRDTGSDADALAVAVADVMRLLEG